MSYLLFSQVKEQYAELGIDVEAALTTLAETPISLHCWQGDDVGGFETGAGELSGGLAVTGNYPGKARTGDEIFGLDSEAAKELLVFHAGTKRDGDKTLTSGGRVLGVAALAGGVEDARAKVYGALDTIRFDGMQYRTDIGKRT